MPPLNGPPSLSVLTRRQALQALAASVAASVGGCSKPDQEIVPAVLPSGSTAGEPRRFATCLPLAGYGRGVMAISVDGRPIKIEGNTHHPASLGATDVFAEAEVLSLYDPDRSRAPRRSGAITTHEQVLAAWQGWRAAAQGAGRAGQELGRDRLKACAC